MKAAVFVGPGLPFEIEELPDPAPGPGQVVVRVERCGICASDLAMTSGDSAFVPAPRAVMGHEIAGVVASAGPGVTAVAVGDRVAVVPRLVRTLGGGYAEVVVAAAEDCLRLPPGVSPAVGALVEPLAVALAAVERAALAPGCRVLVLGAGPLGLAVLHWLARDRRGRVVVTAASERRAANVAEVGADDFVATTDPTSPEVLDALGGKPHAVFECVGRPGVLAGAVTAARSGGTVVVLGSCMRPETFVPAHAAVRDLTMHFPVGCERDHFTRTIAAVASGALRPERLVTGCVSLEALPTTIERLRGPREDGKIQLDPRAEPTESAASA